MIKKMILSTDIYNKQKRLL